MNMDYVLCQALKSTQIGEMGRVLMYYDVNCQYIKKLNQRIDRNPNLAIDPSIELTAGIGLLHVTEHKAECGPRFSPTFINGAGLVAGEIIESLWSSLNGCAHST